MRETPQILLVDDHPLVRTALRLLIEKHKAGEVIGECNSCESARAFLAGKTPDLAILDMGMPDSNGPESIRQLLDVKPDLPILVLSTHDEATFAARCLKAKARGYVMKKEPPESILDAIRMVLEGKVWSDRIKNGIVEGMAMGKAASESPLDVLTGRELELFQLLGQGMTSRAVAKKMGISVKTVDAHFANIKRKLNQTSSKQVLRMAAVWSDRESRLTSS